LAIRNNQIVRANNRDHSGINGEFLCVKGRFGWDFVNSEKRLTAPRIRRNGRQEQSTWEESLGLTVERLKSILAQHGPEAVAVVGSNRTTNEENYLLGRFARTVLGTNNLDHHRTADYCSLVGALTEARATDCYATMQDVFDASSLLLIGNDPTHQHPLVAYQIRQAVRQRGARLYIINSGEIKLRRQASIYLKVRPEGEIEAVRALAAIISPPVDLVQGNASDLAALREKLSKESDTVIIFGDVIRGEAIGDLVRWGLGLPGRARFVALGDYANSRGAADMGLLPNTLPGYAPLADPSDDGRQRFETGWGAKIPATPGRDLREILDGIHSGDIKALLVFGSNPVKTIKLEPATLGKLAFLLVAELFPTETAEMADVVLPATSFAEKSGTVTNTCGQIQALKKTMRLTGTRSDLEILLTLARLFGQAWPYNSPDDVLREIIARVPGYAIALPNLLLGRAVATRPEGRPPALERPDLIFSSRDSLFTSGTVSRYSWALNSVDEARKPNGHLF
ncbi:MAG: molybdopterin-dependent oxidoreductase, partial [Acidobacteria bacterium]|nr:molybdopterin-dependent oxidoreductase [Acidobacteriota bacterium]